MIYTAEIIKQKQNNKQKRRKILRIIFFPFIILALLLVLHVGYSKFIKHESNVSILGFRTYMVITRSMEPSYNAGDLIIVKEKPTKDLKVGDVINFQTRNGDNTVTHRITEIIELNGEKQYKTKGDNNNTEDQEPVQENQIKGVVLFKIDKIGAIITKLMTGTGIIVVGILIILSYLRTSRKEEKRIARENARKLYNVPKYKKEDTV